MGCFASRPASITPTGSPRPPLLLASSVSGLPQSKSPVGNKVAPNTPVALTTVVPVSPPGPPAQDPISPDKRKKLHIVVSSPQSGVAPECARSPTPHEPLVEGPARSSPTALRPPDPSVDPVVAAMSDVMKPSGSAPPSLILPTSPRSLSIGEVVSAKAAAARKARRGTVESTELRESLDTNGRKVVNQYTVLDLLGQGSYGKVKRCVNLEENTFFAVKIVKKSILKRKRIGRFGTALDNIKKELAIWKKLDHENVVVLFEVIDDPEKDKLYMISELVDGGPVMKDHGEQQEPIAEEKARRVIRQLLQALEYLHFQKIIHRDIKPGNLLLTKGDVLKVADFGVSFMYDGEDDTVQSSAGTAAFLAPELCSGQATSGKTVDLWATGITLYMMLTGKVPFMAPTLPEIYEKIKTASVEYPPGMNPAAIDLIHKLLCKDPQRRITVSDAKKHAFLSQTGLTRFVTQMYIPIVATPEEVNSAITKRITLENIVLSRRLSQRLISRARSSIASRSASLPPGDMRTLSDAVIAAGCSTPDPSQLGQHHTLLSDDSHVSPPRLVGEENISPTKAARQVQPPRMLIEVQSDDGTDEASDTVDIPLPVAAQLGIPLSPMQTPVLSASNSPDGVARGRKPGPGSLNTRGPVLSRRLSASSTPVRSSPLNPNTTTAAALGQRDPSALARTPLLSDPPPGHEDVVDVTQFSTPPRTPFASVGLGADDDLVNMSNSFNFPPTTPESPPA